MEEWQENLAAGIEAIFKGLESCGACGRRRKEVEALAGLNGILICSVCIDLIHAELTKGRVARATAPEPAPEAPAP